NIVSSHGSPASNRVTSAQPPHWLAASAARNTAAGVRREESSTTKAIIRLALQERPWASSTPASAIKESTDPGRERGTVGPAVRMAAGELRLRSIFPPLPPY